MLIYKSLQERKQYVYCIVWFNIFLSSLFHGSVGKKIRWILAGLRINISLCTVAVASVYRTQYTVHQYYTHFWWSLWTVYYLFLLLLCTFHYICIHCLLLLSFLSFSLSLLFSSLPPKTPTKVWHWIPLLILSTTDQKIKTTTAIFLSFFLLRNGCPFIHFLTPRLYTHVKIVNYHWRYVHLCYLRP